MRTSEAASGLGEFDAQRAPGRAISQNRPGTQGRPEGIRQAYEEKGRGTKAPQKCAAHFVSFRTPCACCGREYLKQRRWQEACSRDCQLIYLAARTFLKAYREGRADGLRDIIEELKK